MAQDSSFRISVILPTWNRRRWLPQALDSVLQQTLPPHEIIVVDDGSTDGTLEALAPNYPAVRWIRQENRGPAAARNAGARAATGNWLAFLDSDDRWLPEKLQKQVAFLKEHPDYEVVHTNEIWIRNGRRVNPKKKHQKYGGWIYPQCLPLCIISPSSLLISRRLWEELGGFDESYPACEDYELWLRLAARHPVGYLPEPLIVKHGGHADQLSRQWGLDRYRVRALQSMLERHALPADWHEATRRELLRKCEILIQGYEKHGRSEEAGQFRQIWQRWAR